MSKSRGSESVERLFDETANLRRCPWCYRPPHDYVIYRSATGQLISAQLQCWYCGARGPIAKDESRAVDKWNERNTEA